MIYLQLFWAYFKVGLFAIGGGMATIPFLYDLSDKTGWFTHAQLADMLAVSESTPGAHRREHGDLCGICDSRNSRSGGSHGGAGFAVDHCDFAYCTVLSQFRHSRQVEAAFYGLRPASAALVAAAGMSAVMLSLFDLDTFHVTGAISDLLRWKAWILAIVVLVLTNWVKRTRSWHPIVFIALSAVAGVVFGFAGT